MAVSPGGMNQQDDSNLGVFLIVGCMIFIALGYYLFHQKIIAFMFYVKGMELEVISHFLPNYESLTLWMRGVPLDKVTYNDLRALAVDVGEPLQLPLIIITVVLAVIAYRFHPDVGFRNKEDMVTLKEKMRDVFPCLKVVDGVDLINEPLNKGPWAMALTPVEFAKKYRLIHKDATSGEIIIDQARAKTIFASQLGRPWKGIEDLSAHERAIFGVLSAYVNYKRSLAEKTLEDICEALTPDKLRQGKLDFHAAEKLLEKYGGTAEVQAVVKQHGYVMTVFSAMLQKARSTGIVANSIYLWLKPIDRELWYVLNNVGRRAVFSEAAAVRAHFLAEESLGSAISMPMVDEAVNALVEAIHSRIIREV